MSAGEPVIAPRPVGGLPAVDVVVDLAGARLPLVQPASTDALLEAAAAGAHAEAPYWAAVWPAARALAEHLVGRDLNGRRVLELGCGLALPAVAAATRGARVVASDVDPRALAFARENARLSAVELATLTADLTAPSAELRALAPFDLVLAADVLYEPALARSLAGTLAGLVAPGGAALVAYPWRGQAAGLEQALARRGWRTLTLAMTTRGWHHRPSPVWLLTANAPAAHAARAGTVNNM